MRSTTDFDYSNFGYEQYQQALDIDPGCGNHFQLLYMYHSARALMQRKNRTPTRPRYSYCAVLTHRRQVESSTPNITAFASRGGKILQCE